MSILTIAYAITLVGLAIYAVHALWLRLSGVRLPSASRRDPSPGSAPWPTVTVALPIYNEPEVAVRVIDAACALDYPPDQIDIQVLDDSTDHTRQLIAHSVSAWQARGINIEHLRRSSRHEYKAGNMAFGVAQARGQLIAVFDSDFVPVPAWLRHTTAHFGNDTPRLGVVQTRWDHLNAALSALTRAQALILDDYADQQLLRYERGLLPVFTGSAGLWKRECIIDAGGWSGRTLSDDLDLSYRAQLAGWQVRFDPTVLASAEVPAQIASYKRQQYRWAKGTLQAARILAGPLLRGPLTWRQKVDALLFLTSNTIHLLLVLLLLCQFLVLIWPAPWSFGLELIQALLIVGLCLPTLLDWWRGRRSGPIDLLLQCGIAPVGAAGVLAGLLGPPGGEYHHTPKTGASQPGATRASSLDWTTLGEFGLLAIAVAGSIIAVWRGEWLALPILVLYVIALGWINALELGQTLQH
jgi:cellulose synthase/poly-beta-1,6-N-acetylglucosamine synthase-like glycosyltransferase